MVDASLKVSAHDFDTFSANVQKHVRLQQRPVQRFQYHRVWENHYPLWVSAGFREYAHHIAINHRTSQLAQEADVAS
jgi:hypothetical protein